MFRKPICIISFAAVLGMGLTIPAEAADPDLAAYWTFDEGSGNTAFDSSGNGNDGTFVGNPQWVAGQFGGALEFDGDDYVNCGNGPSLQIRDAITMAFWFKVDAFQNTWEGFMAKGDNSYRASRGGGDGNATHMGVSGTSAGNFNGTVIVTGGDWHHYAGVYDGTNARIYIDGVQDVEVPATGQMNSSTYDFWIGNNSQQTGRFLHGLLDDVRIYSRALTDFEILGIMAGGGAEFPFAAGPSPEDGALLEQTWVTMGWRAGDSAVSHDVYFADNFDDVNDGGEAAFQGNRTDEMFIVGFPGFPYPDGLVPGTIYYWRIDEVNDADPNSPWKGDVWSFRVPPKKAYNPAPVDNAGYVDADMTLSWTAGFGAKLHTVYFGDDFDTVSNATGGALLSETTFAPGALEPEKTYYWRVDELDPPNTHKGDVWSFRTVPDIPLSDPSLVGWWKFDEDSGMTALDWSGHGNHGTIEGDPQWVAGQVGGALEFDGTGDLVDCGNGPDLNITGDITLMCWIKVAAFSKTWETILSKGDNSYRMSRGPGTGDSIHFAANGTGTNLNASTIVTTNTWRHVALVYDGTSKIVYIDGAEDVRLASSGGIDVSTYDLYIGANAQQSNRNLTGLVDDVRIYNRVLAPDEITEAMRGEPDLAWGPKPANGSTPDVKEVPPLTWLAGDSVSEHDVYFSTDRDALASADESDTAGIYRGRQTAASFAPSEGIEWGGGPYFWRIDEYNTDGTISKGRIWSFSAADFLIVDDIEDYTDNDTAGEAIWQHWIDGFGDNANGSQAGNLLPPYAEQSIVHGGSQSMPLFYTNTAGVTNSEAELKLGAASSNWTDEGVGELSIWFQGQAASTGSFTEGPVGTFTMTGSGTDITGTSDEFHYAYRTLTGPGSIIAKVESVQNTNAWAKAGVMIRSTLDPDSQHAMAFVTPGQGVVFEYRQDTGSSNAGNAGRADDITAPHWVKIERDIGGNFAASHSTDGSAWQMLGTPQSIQMGGTIHIGLALTSHNASATCEAVFSNVTTTGNVAGQWANQEIGIAANAAEPLYVAVSNATGSPVVVAHPDPAAANAIGWTEWVIPLSTFSDQGINLNAVDKIAIGLGTGSGVAGPGGSGAMLIDDIRLYRPRP